MKIICTQENLKNGLVITGKVSSSTNTLPILNNLMLSTENGQLKISSTNLEIAVNTYVRCKIEQEGEVTVGSKTITELVNNLPSQNITLESVNGEMRVDTENYHTSVKTLPAEDFPLIPKVESEKSVEIEAQAFKNSIDQVVFAASQNQTQPEISGVLLALDNKKLRVVATDRYRLAEKQIEIDSGQPFSEEIIVPQKTIQEISRIIGSQKGGVVVSFGENQVGFSFKDTVVVSRLVDGHYPDYRQIIPTEFRTTTTTQKQSLINALKTVSIFSQNTNSVNLLFSPEKQQLVLNTESQDLGKSEVELPARIEGVGGSVVLNHHYILDCLSSVGAQEVVIKFIDDNSPSIMLPEGKTDYRYLVMPIKS